MHPWPFAAILNRLASAGKCQVNGVCLQCKKSNDKREKKRQQQEAVLKQEAAERAINDEFNTLLTQNKVKETFEAEASKIMNEIYGEKIRILNDITLQLETNYTLALDQLQSWFQNRIQSMRYEFAFAKKSGVAMNNYRPYEHLMDGKPKIHVPNHLPAWVDSISPVVFQPPANLICNQSSMNVTHVQLQTIQQPPPPLTIQPAGSGSLFGGNDVRDLVQKTHDLSFGNGS